jgi:4-amino-4-deoxy-L-arabinose transferase-like glycosyltransferase
VDGPAVDGTLFGHSRSACARCTIRAAPHGLAGLPRRRGGSTTTGGALAAFMAALVPDFLMYAAYATPDAPCLLFWSATVWALAHALSGDSPRWWYLAGLFLGLAMDSKYHAVFLGFGIFGFLVLSPISAAG